MMDKLRLCTFNSRGHSDDRIAFINRLFDEFKCDVMMWQESWHYDHELPRLSQSIYHAELIGTSGMDCSQIHAGRPYGGTIIGFNKKLKCSYDVLPTNSKRITACLCNLNCGQVLLINVYLPCDGDDITHFVDELISIEAIIESQANVTRVIIGGDLNTDFSRTQSAHGQHISELCNRMGLTLTHQNPRARLDFSYYNDFNHASSLIDHFVVSENIANSITSVTCVHEGDNLSDHSPVLLDLTALAFERENSIQRESEPSKRPAWRKATDAQKQRYRESLRELLRSVDFPREALACVRLNCDRHSEAIGVYFSQLIEACVTAGEQCIPAKTPKRRVAGWNELVAPQKQESILWHRVWLENNKPRQGWIYELKRKSKMEYKLASRRILKNQREHRHARMATAVLEDRNRDFWSEVKRNNCKSFTRSTTVDGVSGDASVCRLFKDKYEELYNSVPYDRNEMNHLISELDQKIANQCQARDTEHQITTDDVSRAVKKLKHGKSDSNECLTSDHILYGPIELKVHIALLLTTMLRHCHSPKDMLISVLIPIPKNPRKSLRDSANYRSIAISSIIGKILDNIVIAKHHEAISSSGLQFGFKPAHSTTQCTFVLNQVVDHYLQGGSVVCLTLLDASKAFDRVNFLKLFSLLVQKRLCPLVTKLLLVMYLSQMMSVQWNNAMSEEFSSGNGVRQGGVLSPVLFAIYMDVLLDKLRNLGVGCRIDGCYAGALAYADDVTLIAPSFHAMRAMLHECEEFAEKFDVLFNSTKSVSIVINGPEVQSGFSLHDNVIPREEAAIHLGSWIGKDAAYRNEKKGKSELVASVNALKTSFGHCEFDVLKRLYSSYCTSFYGSGLWDLTRCEQLCTTWRKCIRYIFDLPNRTHNQYIAPLLAGPPLFEQLIVRFSKFFSACFTSPNHLVSVCTRSLLKSQTPTSRNLRRLMMVCNMNEEMLWSTIVQRNALYKHAREILVHPCEPAVAAEVGVLKDLLNMKFYDEGPFDWDSRNEFIFALCTE